MFALRRNAAPLSRRAFSTTQRSNSFAKMTIVGHLTDTPELRATSTGHEVVTYSVGTNRGTGENKKASFFRVSSFLPEGAQRDFVTSLDKGTLVYVEGNASMDSYTDSEGKPRSALSIVQSKIEVLSPKKSNQQQQPGGTE